MLLNAFFVGAEFALVRSRRTRLEAMTRSGDRLARIALRASSNISRVLSASQLGVTLASLGLGWVAESTVGDMFATLFSNLPFAIEASVRLTIGATIALIVVTYLHVVFGEHRITIRFGLRALTLEVEATLFRVARDAEQLPPVNAHFERCLAFARVFGNSQAYRNSILKIHARAKRRRG